MLYSHSRLNTFQNCPLQFKHRYIDKTEVEICEGIEAFMGSRVHETMEKLYSDLHHTKLPSLKELISYYENLWEKNWNDDIVINHEGLTQMHYFNLGKKCIENYYNKYKPFDSGKCLAIEKRVEVDLDGTGKYKLQGYIDRLDEAGEGVYEIHDYKTSAKLPEEKELHEDRQLALYSIAVKEMFSDAKKVELVWHYVAFDKEMRSNRTKEDLENLKSEIISIIKEIEKEKEFLPKKSALCSWCPYMEICPEWKHPKKVEKLTPKQFKKDEGVKLADKYTVLYAKKQKILKELETELDELKEDIFEFAKQHDLTIVAGSDSRLRVKIGKKWKFPGSGTEKREELEALIKKEGNWLEVSSLNVFALAKIIDESDWKPALVKKLQNYAEKEEERRIYLGKN